MCYSCCGSLFFRKNPVLSIEKISLYLYLSQVVAYGRLKTKENALSTRIRRFLYPQIFLRGYKISASTRSVYESYTTVHTYPIRIRTSQRISQQSMRITKKAEPAIILAPNSRLSCLFTWGFNTCELEERKKFLLKTTIKNVSIKRKTEKNQRQLICLDGRWSIAAS